jgi:ubiquitin-conjugating enzyme E2 M
MTIPNFFETEAAEDLRRDRSGFLENVKTSLRGGRVKGEIYNNVLASKS